MITEYITYFPHNLFEIKTETTNNLRISDYIQYGYIKKRDLNKWENNEVCAVKMGMLTPSNKTYRGKTIVESALSRIKEQDTTALFDDDDELIPIYVFVSNETDNEWREYLQNQGFVSSRKNASREGIRITRKEINLHYGKHYGYDTEEIVNEKEKKEKELKKEKEQQRNNFEKLYGVGTYDRCLEKQIKKLNELKKESRINPNIKEFDYHIDFNTLEIKGYSVCNEKVTDIDFECLFGWVFSIIFNIICFNCFNLPDELLLFDGFCFHFVGVIWAILNIVLFLAVFSTKEEQIQKKYYDKPNIK